MYHIVFNADEKYIKYLAVLINSIILHTNIGGGDRASKSPTNLNPNSESNFDPAPYHFHILTDCISKPARDKLDAFIKSLSKIYPCELSIHTLDDSVFHSSIAWGFEYEHSKNYLAYYRLLLARILPQNATKCLYLDTDTLVLCDVRELFALDLGTHILASSCGGVHKNARWDRILRSTKDNKMHTFEVPYYFCSGLMLINLAQWKAQDIESKSVDFLENYASEYADQDALNIIIKGDIVPLPAEYGLLIFQAGFALDNQNCDFKDELQKILSSLKIAHFNGPSHPWLSKYRYLGENALPIDYPYIDKWWEIALETPEFCDELKAIWRDLRNDSRILQDYMKGISKFLTQKDIEVQNKLVKIIAKQNPLKYYTRKWRKSIKKWICK